jgi:hypothetical protein
MIKQIKENKPWAIAEEGQVRELRAKGMTHEQIAQTVSRTTNAVRVRLGQMRSAGRKRREERPDSIRGCYLVKMTDFNTGKVTNYREVVIAEHGGSTRAWNYAMRLIKRRNEKAAKDKTEEFYWMKYL